MEQEVAKSWLANQGKFSHQVNWDAIRLNREKMIELAGLLGGKRVAAVLKNYARDYKFWNHGMPDLILWSTSQSENEQPIIKFSEVKSENDRLSEV